MKNTHRFAVFGSVVAMVACGANPETPKACTEMACDEGVHVSFSFRTAGTYVFDVTVDGVTTQCRATLPLAKDPSASPCGRDDMLLGLSGALLPVEQQSIEGLRLTSKTVRSLRIRATRDGVVVGDKSMNVQYTVTPGPNGPGCEPKECRSVALTFP